MKKTDAEKLLDKCRQIGSLKAFEQGAHFVKDEGEETEVHFLSLRKKNVYGPAAFDGGHIASGRAARRAMARKKYQRMIAAIEGGDK